MKSLINRAVSVLATGFIVLVLLSLPLFWARWLCDFTLVNWMPSVVRVAPSGLVPPELENDPNVVSHSYVRAGTRPAEPSCLGIADYFGARSPGGRHSNIYYYHKDKDRDEEAWMYFGKKSGQIVCRYTDTQRMPDKTILRKKVQLYAGPEGVSEIPDNNLGRFTSPIVNTGRIGRRMPLTLYDKKLRCFFAVNFDERTVIKGPQLSKDDPHEPVKIGLLSKNSSFVYLDWHPPMIEVSLEEAKGRSYTRRTGDSCFIPIISPYYPYSAGQNLLVLDATGRIDLLDRETLEFAGTAGRLPGPETYFGSRRSVTPKDLLAYEVLPLAFDTDHKYRGMFAASVCREGTALAVVVFDENGKVIKREYSRLPKQEGSRTTYLRSSKAVFFEAPWAPTLTITKYLLENLHPPLLSLASYFTADSFEAAAGHRALFILPNSFIAMKGRDRHENFGERFMSALGWILPSIILAIWLACRVSKNATVVGLSENARLYWTIGTLAFGLIAYITYRLTRPKMTLVTCQNCGKLRRPDMNKCHRCKSDWHVPELTPPTWRVLG